MIKQIEALRKVELELLSPPGDTIKETIEELGIDLALFVIRMKMSNTEAAALLKGQTPITPEIAQKLQEVLGADAQFWINQEKNYRDMLAQVGTDIKP